MIVKLYVGTLAALIWVAAIVGKHYWPDLDTSAITIACGSVLSGLGVYHAASAGTIDAIPGLTASSSPASDKGQGGFASIRLLTMIIGLALGLSMLAGCAGLNVSWVATASYNAQAQTLTSITPGVPAQAESAK